MNTQIPSHYFIHYRFGAEAVTNADFGQGSGSVFFEDLACIGTETSILSCPSNTTYNGNCLHTEDAGVICKTGETNIVTIYIHWSMHK